MLDSSGQPGMRRDGTPMTGKDLVEDLKADKNLGMAFGTPGGGGPPPKDPDKGSGGGTRKMSRNDPNVWSEYGAEIASGEVVLTD